MCSLWLNKLHKHSRSCVLQNTESRSPWILSYKSFFLLNSSFVKTSKMEKEVIILFVLLQANFLIVEFVSLISELLKLTQKWWFYSISAYISNYCILIRKSGYNIFNLSKRRSMRLFDVEWIIISLDQINLRWKYFSAAIKAKTLSGLLQSAPSPLTDVFIEPLKPITNIPFCPYDVKIPYRASHLALFHKHPHSSPLNSVAKQSSLCAAMAQESCHAMCWTNAGILKQNFKRVVIVGSVCLCLCRLEWNPDRAWFRLVRQGGGNFDSERDLWSRAAIVLSLPCTCYHSNGERMPQWGVVEGGVRIKSIKK